jgi:hypothetical protein
LVFKAGWQVCESAIETATLESVVDRDISGSEVVDGGVGLRGRATAVVNVEGNYREGKYREGDRMVSSAGDARAGGAAVGSTLEW